MRIVGFPLRRVPKNASSVPGHGFDQGACIGGAMEASAPDISEKPDRKREQEEMLPLAGAPPQEFVAALPGLPPHA
jgi:hypothetical protein